MRSAAYRTTAAVVASMVVFASILNVGCERTAAAIGGKSKRPRVLVIGMDGMDPKLLKQMMDQGRMPNFTKLAGMGGFKPLATSMPPQSPVAWSNFISGSDPGTHQIYDFIHRKFDAGKPTPRAYQSDTDTVPDEKPKWLPKEKLPWLDDYELPLVGTKTVSLRRGPEFWETLVAAGIPTTIYRVPANYPPDQPEGDGHFCCISGMGTPDLRGTMGEFWKFEQDLARRNLDPSGGHFRPLTMTGTHSATGEYEGPENYLQPANKKPLTATFEVVRDPEADVAKIMLGEQVVVLNEGEWSDWLEVEFKTGVPWSGALDVAVPTSVTGTVRLYMQEVHPRLQVYSTALNLDAANALNAISTPSGFAEDLAKRLGRFWTLGIPESTKQLRAGAVNEDEFLAECRLILEERKQQYRDALANFSEGFLFFYFGSTDQLAHVFWRDRDPEHPGLKPGEMEKYGKVVEDVYVEMDGLLGEASNAIRPGDTLIVMSDHGFGSFRRGFNLNTWLHANGYLAVRDPNKKRPSVLLGDVDWTKTRAYALGINSLYINLRGREPGGIVSPGDERAGLMEELASKLTAYHDIDGSRVIDRMYVTEKIYPKADRNVAPDMLVGYAENYRVSWATTLGDIPQDDIVVDNRDRWSGDHCVAAHLVPGILVTNRRITVDDPSLSDIAPTILKLYQLAPPERMTGRVVLE